MDYKLSQLLHMLELLYSMLLAQNYVICDHGSQKGMSKFVSSKRLNFKESKLQNLRRGMAMGDIAMVRGYVLYEL